MSSNFDSKTSDKDAVSGASRRRPRADAQRNLDALIYAAKQMVLSRGVDAPVREIAEKAGPGVSGTTAPAPIT